MRSWVGRLLVLSALGGITPAGADDYVLHEWDKTQLQTKFFCEGANAGDFNKDGKPDIVSGPYWYEGPDFKVSHEYYPAKPYSKNGYSANFFAFADDIDSDGWQDIIIVGFPGEKSWWYRNPQGKDGNWPEYVIDDFVGNESIPYIDLDGDGKKELIYINKRGQYGHAKPDPADVTKPWVFTPISAVSNLGKFTHGLGIGDVNDDGRLDIMDKDTWFEQPPAGTEGFWKVHQVKFAGPGGAQMYAFDVDGDGDNDIVTSLAAHQYGLAWFEKTSKKGEEPAFERHIILKEKPEPNEYGISFSQLHAVDIADMDGDGVLDIVTGKRHWAHNGNDPDERSSAVLYWFRIVRGKSGVDFVPYLIDNDSGVGTQVVVTDLNGDSLPDVVVGNKLGTFFHIHKIKKVSKEEWEKAQPQRTAPTASKEGPADRTAGTFPRDPKGKELNFGFETGNLEGWKAARGTAFGKQPVKGDRVSARRGDMKSDHVGEHWVGTFEAAGDPPQGTLTSPTFEVTHPFASFLVGGGSDPATRVELVDVDSNEVFFRVSGANVENMRPVLVDLSKKKGRKIFVRLLDLASGGWGHINFDDFRFHETKPNLVNELVPIKQDEYKFAGVDAKKAAETMTLPDGFKAEVVAAEPDVKQPIAMTIDERGRIWVVEAYEYPIRAPEGKGRDRILIFEDADGDGSFETRKVFKENLNLVSGIEVGFGGVFVGAAPYLMFIPDANRDDVPDAEPEILLDGWAYQDTHETLNSFIWGPDGWLYGCHGVFTHSNVGKPGADNSNRQRINAGIWRWHPTKKEFEVFAHGTSNPWGVDFNDQGQCFLVCCVIPHLYHVQQGGRYFRQAGTHFNPHTYADIVTVAKHRHYVGAFPHAGNNISDSMGGGHAHSGGMFYLGDTWPQEYRGQLFMNNIHGARLNVDKIEPQGSGYVGDRSPDFLLTNDLWSQIVYFRTGPDDALTMIDWYDANQCHRNEREVHDPTNGRIFRVTYKNAKPVKVDLSKATDDQLVEYQLHKNDWYVRTARRILQERAASGKLTVSTEKVLIDRAFNHPDESRRLRCLWTLHDIGKLSPDMLVRAFADKSPYVRGWGIQLATEDRNPPSSVREKLVALAKSDPSPIVRLYLASAADRMPPAERWEILGGLLAHSEDVNDQNIPFVLWYATEPMADVDPARAMKLAAGSSFPMIAEFMARRIASTKKDEGLAMIVKEVAALKDEARQERIVHGLATALEGQRQAGLPAGWSDISPKLMASMNKALAEESRALAVKFGDTALLAEMRKTLTDGQATPEARRAALANLLSVKDKELPPVLHGLLADKNLRAESIKGLAAFGHPETPAKLLAVYADLSLPEKRDAIAVLASRAGYAQALLEAIGEGKIRSADVGADVVRQLRGFKDASLEKRLKEVWGIVRDSSGDKAEEIAKYKKLLLVRGKVEADIHLGRAVFVKTCATCHEMFGAGENIGPSLTGSNRRDLDYLLHNVIDPSAVMAKDYQPFTVQTTDGRVLTGLIREQNDASIKLRTANEEVVLPRDEIDEMVLSDKSMMPEDQWGKLSELEVRSLVAYLSADAQVPILATADTASLLFNGRDLKGWSGDMKLWSVDNGEIVGRSPGLKHNEFLKSDLAVGDFRLTFKVKLTPNAGNSGVQFRSEPIEGGEMKGYQADIGAGWWGKLYEENGRAILWDKSSENLVKKEGWNDYEIAAVGDRIVTKINGKTAVDLKDSAGAKRGILALQIHAGPAMEVRFKDFKLEVEPKAELTQGAN